MILAVGSVSRGKLSIWASVLCGVTVGGIARETSVSGGTGGRENQYPVLGSNESTN